MIGSVEHGKQECHDGNADALRSTIHLMFSFISFTERFFHLSPEAREAQKPILQMMSPKND